MEVLGNMKIRDKKYVSIYVEDFSRSKRDVSEEMLLAVEKEYPDYTLEGICLEGLECSYNRDYEKFERKGYVEFLLSREVDFTSNVGIDFDNLLYSFVGDDCDYIDYDYKFKKQFR